MIADLFGRALAARLRSTPGVDPRVAEAMIAVPRHRFVRWRDRWRAYSDRSLPTGAHTSISQPTYIAAVISQALLTPQDRVLEIGTGSGYTAAVLAHLAAQVVTVECLPALAHSARRRLTGLDNVEAIVGDGCYAAEGSFDAILVMASAPSIPAAYRERLNEGGRLIIPVGTSPLEPGRCHVMRVTRRSGAFVEERLMPGDWNELTGRDRG